MVKRVIILASATESVRHATRPNLTGKRLQISVSTTVFSRWLVFSEEEDKIRRNVPVNVFILEKLRATSRCRTVTLGEISYVHTDTLAIKISELFGTRSHTKLVSRRRSTKGFCVYFMSTEICILRIHQHTRRNVYVTQCVSVFFFY